MNHSQVDSLSRIKIDSLSTITKTSGIGDTTLVKSHFRLCKALVKHFPDTLESVYKNTINIIDSISTENNSHLSDSVLQVVKSNCLNHLGLNSYYNGEIDNCIEFWTEALAIRKKCNYKSGVANSYSRLGALYYGMGITDSAQNYIEKGLVVAEEIQDTSGIAEALNVLGILYRGTGKLEKSLETHERALELFKAIKYKEGISSVLNNIGGMHYYRGDYERSLECFHESLKIREEQNDERNIAGSLYNLGLIYKDQGDMENCYLYFKKSLSLAERLKDKGLEGSVYNAIGSMHHIQNDLDSALYYYLKSIEVLNETNDFESKATTINNIGSLYDEKNELEKSLEYYQMSLDLYESSNHPKGISRSLNSIGNYYYKIGEYKKAKELMHKSLDIAQDLGYPDYISTTSENLFKVYKKLKESSKALEMYELHIEMRDSLKNEETQEATIRQQTKYEYEKKKALDDADHEKKMALLEEEKRFQQFIIISVAIGLIMIIVFALYTYRRLKITRMLKEEVEEQKEEVETQRDQIHTLHEEVTDSIRYASNIQKAILTSDSYWNNMLSDYFLMFEPKDIVSGDFYWAFETPDKKKIWVTADCTGHGVPGGFMSMLGNTFLNEIIIEEGVEQADKILNQLREKIIKALSRDSSMNNKDGMDLTICILHENKRLEFAGANNPLWVVSKRNEIYSKCKTLATDSGDLFLHEIKGSKMPIGRHVTNAPFVSNEIQLQTGDCVYTFSDGYQDQFGGPKNKKYMVKRMKKHLLSLNNLTMKEQKVQMFESLKKWQGTNEQVDDICVIGVRV